MSDRDKSREQLLAELAQMRRRHKEAGDTSANQEPTDARLSHMVAILESSRDAIIGATLDGVIAYWNEGAATMFGYSTEEACGRHVSTLAPPGMETEVQRIIEVLESGQRVVRLESTGRRKDGSYVDVCLTLSPTRDVRGTLVGVSAVARDITARKTAERALQQSEEKFRLLFERSPDPTLLMDADTLIDCNEAALRMVHAARKDEIVGHRASAAAPERQPDGQLSMEKGQREYEKLMREGANHFEWLGYTEDGEEFWTEVSQTIIPIQGRQVTYTLSRDIGERVMAEKQLRESEERYRVAIEHTNDGVAILGDGEHLYVNRRFLDLFGYDKQEDIFEKGLSILVHPDDLEMVKGYGSKRLAGEPAPSKYEFRGIRRDGTMIFCEASAAKISYLGKPAVLSYFRDITRRKQAQEALKESEERYRSLVELSPYGIVICVDGIIRFANRALTQLVGAETPEQLYGKHVLQFVHPDHHDAVGERVKRIEIDKMQIPLMEQKWVRLDGSTTDVAVLGFPFRYGGRDGVMTVAEDISLRKYAEETLRKRDKELENKSLNLEEANTALKVLLKHRDEEKRALEAAILGNVKELVLPYIEKLRKGHLNDNQLAYLALIESGLNDIVSPFLQRMASTYSRFSPTEVQVANMIKGGKTTKEIAELLHIGKATVDSHRNSIRSKLGLNKKQINLQTFLLSL